jgi:hypothetical protein
VASSVSNERLLTLALLGFGGYFLLLMVGGVARYLRFRRVRPTALLTWSAPRPARFGLLVALGVVTPAVALLNGYLQRPLPHVLSQVVIALYFVLMVPLLARIRPGLYRDGVWAERGFLPYGKIGRLAFLEKPEIVLLLLPKGGWTSAFRLLVPPQEYAGVRKVLEEMSRARILRTDEGILGLSQLDADLAQPNAKRYSARRMTTGSTPAARRAGR